VDIPKLHYISQGSTPEEHLNNIKKACIHGATLVQLRLKNMPMDKVFEVAKKARTITSQHVTKLIINDHYQVAKEVQADGVHLGKTDSCPTIARTHLYDWQLIGGTANTLEDCQSLLSKKVNYIGLGPLRFTATKKNLSPVLGMGGYHDLIKTLQTDTPIIGIGGITINDVPDLLQTGIYGIAVSGEITSNFNSITTFKQLLNTNDIGQ